MTARSPRGRARGPERIGVFGGTFDPPHLGHLALAEWAREALPLDRVLFVPAGAPPHKRGARTPVAHRLAMTRLAIRDSAAFAVSTLETRRRGPSYTVDTLRALAAAHPGAHLTLLVGADMFATLGSWREIGAIARLARIAVAARPGVRRVRAGAWARGGRGVRWLANPGLEVASSAVRARARAGRSVRFLVPDAVARYIARHRLYAGRS
jgi:nicotinate-nucleotide adenylyltransferase